MSIIKIAKRELKEARAEAQTNPSKDNMIKTAYLTGYKDGAVDQMNEIYTNNPFLHIVEQTAELMNQISSYAHKMTELINEIDYYQNDVED